MSTQPTALADTVTFCDLNPQLVLADWGVMTRTLLCKPVTLDTYPWVTPPAFATQERKVGISAAINTLVLNAENVLLTYEVPLGYDMVLDTLSNYFNSTGYSDGSGQIIWRLKIDDYYAYNYGSILYKLGDLSQPYPLEGAGIRIRSKSTIRYIAVVTGLGAMDVNGLILVGISGWIWPTAQTKRGLR